MNKLNVIKEANDFLWEKALVWFDYMEADGSFVCGLGLGAAGMFLIENAFLFVGLPVALWYVYNRYVK